MAERQATAKPEIASQRRAIKLPPAIGDWTTYRPPKVLVKKVKSGLYGFDRLSKEELNEALLIHYRFVQDLLRRFKIDLGLGVEFLACQAEQTTYLNFLRALTGPLAQSRLNLPNLHENIQLLLDLNLANSLINHALGSCDLEPLARALTEAESAAFTLALTEYLPYFAAAFANTFPAPAFTFVGSPDVTLEPAINPASTFVFFAAEIALNDLPGRIMFGYPGNSLKTLLKDYEARSKTRPLNFGRLPAPALNKIMVALSAALGRTALKASELNQLETGDVVALETSINSPVALQLGQRLSFKVQPGIMTNKKRAVRLTSFNHEDEITILPPVALAEPGEAAAVTAPPPVMAEEPAPAAGAPPPAAEVPEETAGAEEDELTDEDFSDIFLEEEEKGG
ncbi:MAG: FliM/FliN family flagellar motor switch protein [Candidatus Saganbacteria bacterium]|nr:FliM/FliN family flagellar motor switch protein [Candidatus Saganbacteria bacterium]